MSKKVVNLSVNGIDELIQQVEEYQSWLRRKTNEFVERMASEGLSVAKVQFAQAVYDGSNDVTVHVETRASGGLAVVAIGSATLFIEFGTGVLYADNHPEAASLGMDRGKYGAGKGANNTWGYYGDPGSNGVTRQKGNGKTVVLTHGNPSNMCMYNTVKDLKLKLNRIAKEVFR